MVGQLARQEPHQRKKLMKFHRIKEAAKSPKFETTKAYTEKELNALLKDEPTASPVAEVTQPTVSEPSELAKKVGEAANKDSQEARQTHTEELQEKQIETKSILDKLGKVIDPDHLSPPPTVTPAEPESPVDVVKPEVPTEEPKKKKTTTRKKKTKPASP